MDISSNTKKMFSEFVGKFIDPHYYCWNTLKKRAGTKSYLGFICGSDQIWNSETLYVDPFYYLQFAPKKKRIAFSPSFGRDYIPKYNKSIISKYIASIPYLSVREESGVELIKNLVNRKPLWIIDPTLIINSNDWAKEFSIDIQRKENILIAYFLNEPHEDAKAIMRFIANELGLKILALPYKREDTGWFDTVIDAGPEEFVKLIGASRYVCTDSFHGTAFAINFKIPFYTFERQYENAGKQSTRIKSLLKLLNMESRYNPGMDDDLGYNVDFNYTDTILRIERKKAEEYLKESFSKMESDEKYGS